MKKVGFIVLIITVIAVGFLLAAKRNTSTESSLNTTTAHQTEIILTETPINENLPKTDQQSPEASDNIAVSIKNSAYSPSRLTIKKGTTVTWTNNDSMQHDVAPDNPTDEFGKSALFGKDGTYSVTFDTPGTYTYHCSPHPFMKGTIEVTE